MKRVVFAAALLFCITPWASPALALGLGLTLALTLGNPFPQESKQGAKFLLPGCVVLLGFGMNLSVVLAAGQRGLLLAAGSIAGTLLLGYGLGRLLKISTHTSALVTVGTAICGGSAIAAVGSVLGAAECEMTVALGTVFLLNAAALYVFPLLGHAMHLSQAQFGTWAGIAIHDISSVVGASARYGLTALQTATAVKLSRALWIIPVSLGAAFAAGRSCRPPVNTPGRLQIPWFIGFFVVASAARTFVPSITALSPALSHLATTGLTMTLFLIGAGLSRETLGAVGWKPLVQGLALWLVISAGSLFVILRTVS